MPQTISKVKDDLEVSINSHYSGLSRLSLYEKYISYLYIYIYLILDVDMEIMKDTPGAMLEIPEVINGDLVNCKHIG